MSSSELDRAAPDKTTSVGKWTCPTCGRDGVSEFRPFCSGRCANRDLGRWLDGSYVLSGQERSGAYEFDDDEEG